MEDRADMASPQNQANHSAVRSERSDTREAVKNFDLPWSRGPDGNFSIFNSSGIEVAQAVPDVSTQARRDVVSFIVRACNAHDDMMAALKHLVEVADAVAWDANIGMMDAALDTALAAIARAEGR